MMDDEILAQEIREQLQDLVPDDDTVDEILAALDQE